MTRKYCATRIFYTAAAVLLALPGIGQADELQTLLAELQAEAAQPFSADAGRDTWHRSDRGRSCTTCHTDSLFTQGRHERTGKIIEPMAPSVNPERLTRIKKINKWFKRNCKWTIGRECTAQEKGDILTWLKDQ